MGRWAQAARRSAGPTHRPWPIAYNLFLFEYPPLALDWYYVAIPDSMEIQLEADTGGWHLVETISPDPSVGNAEFAYVRGEGEVTRVRIRPELAGEWGPWGDWEVQT